MARPIWRASWLFSSASVDIPSNPRKDNTATETAPSTNGQLKVGALKKAVRLNPLPRPCASATAPMMRKTANTASSATSMILLTRAVISMPM